MARLLPSAVIIIFYTSQDLDRIAEANELFDAVLTGSVNQDKNVATKESLCKETSAKEEDKSTEANTPKRANYLRRLSVYVGHFPWVS